MALNPAKPTVAPMESPSDHNRKLAVSKMNLSSSISGIIFKEKRRTAISRFSENERDPVFRDS